MGTNNSKTWAEYLDERDNLIEQAADEWDSEDYPHVNTALIELANQAITAGYGDRIATDRNYRPELLTPYATIEDAVRAYVAFGETGEVWRDKVANVYLLDRSDRDLQEWLAYFELSLWGCEDQPDYVVSNMINACANLGDPDSQAFLGCYRVSVANVKHLAIED